MASDRYWCAAPLLTISILLTSALESGCSGEEAPSNSSGDSPASAAGGTPEPEEGSDDLELPGDGPGAPDGQTCTTDAECPGEVCHPFGTSCVPPGAACTSHSQCAPMTFCSAGHGGCLPAGSGNPCESDSNCAVGSECIAGTCGCSGFTQEQELAGGKLDIYFLFDHTGSMIGAGSDDPLPGGDCAYVPGATPDEESKACFATYAFADYLIGAPLEADTRLALQFLSLDDEDGDVDTCGGEKYDTPLIPMTQLPVTPDHPMIQVISDDDFDTENDAGDGTEMEGAIRGIIGFTSNNITPGREMIGVLMTDGDPNGCNEDIDDLAALIAAHYAQTGLRTFIIGMEGASEDSLEQLAMAGGAELHDDYCGSLTPPCHYWNVGTGDGTALADALQAIIAQSTPLGCEFPLADIQPPDGRVLDTSTINIALTTSSETTTIARAASVAECPVGAHAWYYDAPDNPSMIHMCPETCSLVTAAEGGAHLNIVGGCEPTVVITR